MEDFEYEQLEKIVKYELMGTEDKEIISKFIEKIKNREESENIMMNAARIINKEIRKQRKNAYKRYKSNNWIKWKGDWKAVRRVTITNFVKIIAIKEIYSIICVV